MANRWTEAQLNAIELRDKTILVSAAAGSGKTAVLVERIIRRILDEDAAYNVDELLVMTFTRAAAAEMKERIANRIRIEMENAGSNSHTYRRLRYQLALIDSARIMTIDSFCLSIIREHIDKTELDPSFRVADSSELMLIKEDVLDKLMEDMYADRNEDFIRLLDSFAGVRSDKKIRDYIENLYNMAVATAWPEKWLESLIDNKKDDSWEDYIVRYIKHVAGDIISDIELAIDICRENDGMGSYLGTFETELAYLIDLKYADTYDEIRHALAATEFSNIGRCSKDTPEDAKNRAKAIRDAYKKLIKENLIPDFTADEDMLYKEEAYSRDISRALVELVREYIKRLGEEKLRRNIADFSDLEHFALQILWNEDGTKTDIAREYASEFKEIYVDEYQDSSMVQDELVRAIESGNVFMVGDVKQSIYAFRQAKPEIFVSKYNKFAFYDADKEDSEVKIVLDRNFRSRTGVINSINELFYRIMDEPVGGVVYDEHAALTLGADYKELEKKMNTELVICAKEQVGEDEDGRAYEARVVADRIKHMVDVEQLIVRDAHTGEYRKIRYSDIVILCRVISGFAETFVDVLTLEGIPAHAQTSTGFFDTLEIKLVLAMLASIDNPYIDIEFAAYLHSYMVGISDTELALITAEYRKNIDAHTGVRLYAACKYIIDSKPEHMDKSVISKLEKACSQLEEYRKLSKYVGITELIRAIYDGTGFLEYASALPAGQTRRANLMMLIDRANDYARTGYRGLFNFIRYISNLKKYDTDYGEAPSLGEHDNTVRIMTIHKSKGLEFPVCFVCGMGKKFNQTDIRQGIIVDNDLGIGCDYVDTELRIKHKSVKKNVIGYKKKNEAIGEELRILYVAMSRAKELMIMTALCSERGMNRYKHVDSYKRKSLKLTDIASAGSYIDLLLMAESGIAGEIDIKIASIDEKISAEQDIMLEHRDILDKLNKLKPLENEGLKYLIQYEYPFREDIHLHSKLSVSELKSHLSGDDSAYNYNYPEKDKDDKLGGSERGSAYHRLLELMDYKAVSNLSSLKVFVEDMVNKGNISRDWADCIDLSKIMRFIESELGQSFIAAYKEGRLRRETVFTMELPADEITDIKSKETVLIQGAIDAYIEDKSGITLVDYKTDRVRKPDVLVERYTSQLNLYAKALEMMKQKQVKAKIMWSFELNKAIPLLNKL